MSKNSSEINQLIVDFNTVLYDLAISIADVCPNSIIGKNIGDVKKTINNKEYRTKFIEIFVAKVLVYKEKIDAGEESFFLSKSYEKDFEGNESQMHQIFEFKSIWSKLKHDNKELVKQYMQILCELAQNYFLCVYG